MRGVGRQGATGLALASLPRGTLWREGCFLATALGQMLGRRFADPTRRWAEQVNSSAIDCSIFSCLSFLAHIRWCFPAEKILARRDEGIHDLSVLLTPTLMLDTARNHSNVAGIKQPTGAVPAPSRSHQIRGGPAQSGLPE